MLPSTAQFFWKTPIFILKCYWSSNTEKVNSENFFFWLFFANILENYYYYHSKSNFKLKSKFNQIVTFNIISNVSVSATLYYYLLILEYWSWKIMKIGLFKSYANFNNVNFNRNDTNVINFSHAHYTPNN